MAASAIRSLPKAKQHWVSKLAAKFLPYGKNMKWWKLREQAKCPRCTCPEEDKEHFLRCPAESAVAQWNKALKELDNWLAATKTHLQIRREILTGLQQWHDDQPEQHPTNARSTAYKIQEAIGWGLALEGCLAARWREEQDQYWKAFKSRKSSKRWTTALIKRLMMTAWDMWHHRNEALHKSKTNQQEIIEASVNSQIIKVYEQDKKDLPKEAWCLMKRPLKRLLRFPEYYKQQWLATLEAVQERFARQQRGLSSNASTFRYNYITR